MPITVSRLTVTPVKGTRVREVAQVELDRSGVRENRRFFLIDSEDKMVNSLRLGGLQEIVSFFDEPDRRLKLEFPDGRVLEADVRLGSVVETRFYRASLSARLVEGPWSEAISQHVGAQLRLVEAPERGGVDRGPDGGVSLISQGSLEKLASIGGLDEVDPRRFRMLVEVDGLEPHAEDEWVGRVARIADAVVEFGGHVGRCAITTRHPETGEVDVATLKILGRYRQDVESTEPIPFGIYGRVLEPGAVRVGDEVRLDGYPA